MGRQVVPVQNPLEVNSGQRRAVWKRKKMAASLPATLSHKKLLALCRDPAQWICASCGTTDALLLCLAPTPGIYCCGEDGSGGHAASVSASLWLALDAPFSILDGGFKPVNVGTNRALSRTIASARSVVRELKSLGGPSWAHAHKWERIRLAVKLFGTPFLSRPAQLKRLEADLRATAILRWQHADLGRAFRTWRSFARSPAPAQLGDAARVSATKRPRAGDAEVGTQATSRAERSRLARRGHTGLRNLGNTCYMNSTIQLVGHLTPLRAALLALRSSTPAPISAVFRQLSLSQLGGSFDASHLKPTPDDSPPPPPLSLARHSSGVADLFDTPALGAKASHDDAARPVVAAVHELLSRLWGEDALAVFSPDAFLKRMWLALPRFAGFRQQDAEEWLRALLSAIDTELTPPTPAAAPLHVDAAKGKRKQGGSAGSSGTAAADPKPPSLLSGLLGGAITSTVTCLTCKTSSETREEFFGAVSLEVPASARGGQGRCTLEECFAADFADEKLEGSCAYACSKCKVLRSAVKSRRFAALPPILLLHIVRTDWAGGGKKLKTLVRPPLPGSEGSAYLDLSPWVAESKGSEVIGSAGRAAPPGAAKPLSSSSRTCNYDLRSLVEHVGSSMTQGHYMNCSQDEDGNWWQYNDARVSRVSSAQVGATQAYLMAFERRKEH
jgi:ubiquitin C-terminal hydrolase